MPGGTEQEGEVVPLVETGRAGDLCRAASCLEDPQAGAVAALERGAWRELSDLLAEPDFDPDWEQPDRQHRTLLHLAAERGSEEVERK